MPNSLVATKPDKTETGQLNPGLVQPLDMNIALRPSGGRGEYELAGRQGELHVHDLFELPIYIEILPSVAINAYSHCVLRDGKLSAVTQNQPARVE
jgi:hypothetical protein